MSGVDNKATQTRSLAELSDLSGRVAVITGGAGHIGTVFGETLAEMGAAIAVVDMAEEHCVRIAADIGRSFGVDTTPLIADLSVEDDVREIAGRVVDRLGRLDILVNCASLVGTMPLEGWNAPFLEQSADTWREALEVNLTAPFVLVQTATEALRKSGHGSVVNVSSVQGMIGPDLKMYEGLPLNSPAAYGASKAGLVQITRWLATVLAPEIRVNAISPGGVWRNQPADFGERYAQRTPLQRMAAEEDLKGAIAFLASDMSAYVTGQNLVVDGGWTTW